MLSTITITRIITTITKPITGCRQHHLALLWGGDRHPRLPVEEARCVRWRKWKTDKYTNKDKQRQTGKNKCTNYKTTYKKVNKHTWANAQNIKSKQTNT